MAKDFINYNINEEQNLVSNAMGNVASAENAKANADMSNMVLAGELGKDVLSVENNFEKFEATQNYYSGVSTAQNFFTQAAKNANETKQIMEYPNLFNSDGTKRDPNQPLPNSTARLVELAQIKNNFNHKQQGLLERLNKSNVPISIKSRTVREIQKLNSNLTDNYNKRNAYYLGQQSYSNFMDLSNELQQSNYENADISGLTANYNQLIYNPEVSERQKQEVTNAYNFAKTITANRDKLNQPNVEANSFVHSEVNSDVSHQDLTNSIKNMFVNATPSLLAVNPTKFDVSKNMNIVTTNNQLVDMQKQMANSQNLELFNNSIASNGNRVQQTIANTVRNAIKNNLGANVLRSLHPDLDKAYKLTLENPNNSGYFENYSNLLHGYANHQHILNSNLMDLPPQADNALNQVNEEANTNTMYPQILNSTLNNISTHMGGAVTYGTSDNSNMLKLYKNGNKSIDGFSDFIASVNSDYAKPIAKEYKVNGGSKILFSDDLNKNINTLSVALQIPQSKVEQYTMTYIQNEVNNGMSLSDAKGRANNLLSSYFNQGDLEVGNNYIMDRNTLNNLIPSVKPDVRQNVITGALDIAYQNAVKNASIKGYDNEHPNHLFNKAKDRNALLEPYGQEARDELGTVGNYELIDTKYTDNNTRLNIASLGDRHDYSARSSNGNLIAYNNVTGRYINLNQQMIKQAIVEYKDKQRKLKEVEDLKKPMSTFKPDFYKTTGGLVAQMLDVESTPMDIQ